MRPRLSAMFAVLIFVVALLGIAGCRGFGNDTHVLDGTAWRLTGWTLSSLDPHDFTITVQFANGKISGRSAVNAYGGPYTAGPGAAFSVGDLAITDMGGLGPDMRAEQVYLALLGGARSFKRDGDRLTLFDQHGNESLVFQTAQP
jgi:heat shock protein HslJ